MRQKERNTPLRAFGWGFVGVAVFVLICWIVLEVYYASLQ